MIAPARRLLAATAALALALLAPAAAATATPLGADTSAFTFDSFDGRYELGIDAEGRSTLHVTETLVARFPDFDQNRGIIRAIPVKHGEVDLNLRVLSVTDERGEPVYWERDDVDGFAELALGTDEFVHGATTYVIEYEMRDAIRHFSDSGGDEFYWDINGNGWQQPFERVSAVVLLSPELTAALTGSAACYLGYYGATGACELGRDEAGTRFEASVGPVSPYNTLTLSIGFAGGTVVQPALPRDSWIVQIAPKILAGASGVLLAVALVIRTVFWRDQRGRGIVIAQYTPPKDSDVLLDANIIVRPGSGLQAMLVDFAVRGLVKIVDTQPHTPAWTDQTQRYAIELVTTDGASAAELKVLVILVGASPAAGKRVNPGSLSASIGASLYGLPATAALTAQRKGYRFEAGSARVQKWLRRLALWSVLLFIPIWAWLVFFDVAEGSVVWLAIITAVIGLVTAGVTSRPRRLTSKGSELKEHLLGLRQYLTIAEEDRLRVLQSPQGALRVDVTDRDAVVKLNERLLGYAVLWGVEDQWVEVLRAQYPQSTPAWIEGGSLDATFLRGFTAASTSSVRPIVTSSSSGGSSWSSSGGSSFSSGSSGGGFSGGGGGGGGGGGR